MSIIERIPDPANFAHMYPPLFNYNGYYPARGRNMEINSQSNGFQHSQSPGGTWNPTFDLRDDRSAYELQADLPGVDQNDLRIEFISEDVLRISGHKKQRQEYRAIGETNDDAAVSSDEDWLETVNNIDAATTGPSSNARRTSIINAATYQAPAENIDQWTAITPKNNESRRRSSITNAQAWQQPKEDLDAYSHNRAHGATRRQYRRQSIVDASTWEVPAENIDRATSGPTVKATSPAPKYGFARPIPEENIDAGTVGNPRNIDMVTRPRSRRRSQQSPQPYLFTERPAGSFDRTFSFPSRVVQDELKSTLKDGVLTVIVPKRPVLGKANGSKKGASSL